MTWLRKHRQAPTGHERVRRRIAVRLGLQAAGIVSVIVVVLTVTATLMVLAAQHTAADTLLTAANARAIDVLDPPANVWLVALTPSGALAATPGTPDSVLREPALRETASSGIPRNFVLTAQQRQFMVHTTRREDGVTLLAALDLSANHAERDRLVASMLLTGILGLLFAAGTGTWLARKATQPISTALALQQRFVSGASHELRTPVTLLSTRAQMLRRKLRAQQPAATDLVETAGRLVTDTARLATILDELLLAAAPTPTSEHTVLDLHVLAADVAAEFEPHARAQGVTVSCQRPVDGQLPPLVRGSSVALRRAIAALVDNALRHSRSRVEITTHRHRRGVVIDVRDDGPGIDPEIAPRIFDRFTSSHTPDAGGRRHYGLGLALVSDIVSHHAGAVALLETTSAGTTMRITLPGTRADR